MNVPADPLSLASATRIDALCDQFESAWRAGSRPRIEDLLDPLPAPQRPPALAALLRVEIELRQRAGELPAESDYAARFSADSAAVSAVFAELAQQPATDTSVVQAQTQTISMGRDQTANVRLDEPPPTEIGRFAVLGTLGEGAFGTVYRARDPRLDREVAIKVPRPGTLTRPEDVERFLRESKVAATMQHPNICPVYEVGTANGRPFIVMALVPGKSLADHLRNRREPFPPRQAALIVRKLAQALELAHQKGIIHRDLKPANILIDDDRKDVVVMDFGLARREEEGAAQLTHSGMLMGTPAYMSPEQARSDTAAIGPVSDVYSLGVMLYELLAGERPFTGSLAEVLGKILHVEPPPPSAVRAGVDPRLEAIAMRAMAKRPADRYPSMRALADALGSWLKGSHVGDSRSESPNDALSAAAVNKPIQPIATASAPSARPLRSRPWPALAAAGLVAGLLAAATVFFLQTPHGTVRIEINDPAIKVVVDRGIATFQKADKDHVIKLKPGQHGLTITRGDFTFDTTRFELKKRGQTSLKIEFLAGNIQVTQDGRVLGSAALKEAAEAGKDVPLDAESAPPVGDHVALLFDGIDDYVEIADWKYDGSHPLTVEAWVTPEKLPKGVEIISTSEQSGFNLAIWKDDRWAFSAVIDSKGTWALAPFEPAHANRRIHIAGVYGREQVRLYLDGKEMQRVPAPGAHTPSTQPLILGGNPNSGKIVFHYAGQIDEVRLSRVGRYAGNFQPSERFEADADTLALYHFDEGAGDVLKDASSHNRHGKIVGASWVDLAAGQTTPSAPVDAHRAAAEWVFRMQGIIPIVGEGGITRQMRSSADLPAQPFQLTGFYIEYPAVPFDAEGITRINGLQSLQSFGIEHDELTDQTFCQLEGLSEVFDLDIHSTQVTDVSLVHVATMPKVRRLNFGRTAATGQRLDELQALDLEALILHHAPVGDEALAHLPLFPNLNLLVLNNTKVTDAGLAPLAKLSKLTVLDLGKTGISGAGLAPLKGLPKLERLRLVEAAGVGDEAVEHLAEFTQLKLLELNGTGISADGLARLRAALPNCRIQPE